MRATSLSLRSAPSTTSRESGSGSAVAPRESRSGSAVIDLATLAALPDLRWQLKRRARGLTLAADFASPDGWIDAQVPGTVHQDLLAAGQIPDPFFGRDELQVQGLGHEDFLYRCRFTLPSESPLLQAPRVALCCAGLDTFATLWLNDDEAPLAQSDNMFVPLEVAVQGRLRAGENELRLLFEAAFPKGQAREAAHGRTAVWNGDASRVYVRKAQYHYGWDWGPCLLTAGPWLPITLQGYAARIVSVAAPASLTEDLQLATLAVRVQLEGRSEGMDVELELRDPDGVCVQRTRCAVADARPADSNQDAQAALTIEILAPRLWWPVGQGLPERYTLTATLRDGEEVQDQKELRLGLRRVRLVHEELRGVPKEQGAGFTLEINGRPLFCGGANWIPADSFLPRVSPERYRALLQAAVDANMNMVRVWGGGVYEVDAFYDLCDELGLMVWQDFLFACGIYPATPWFQDSVRAEAEAALVRLRHHPSIVLWCGNNEDYALARSLGRYPAAAAANGEGPAVVDPFPARVIYEELLPKVCAALDPERPYWPGSPYGGDDPNTGDQGDRHTWDVWHGAMAEYQAYPRYAGRFVSEFGMQAHPALATLKRWLPPEDLAPESAGLLHHNKADQGPARLHYYMHQNLPVPPDLAGQVYASQLMQAEALDHAFRGFRRGFGGPGERAISGALVWQLNDCWPVTSWAVIDYALRNKGAYYAIRRALAPLAVGLAGSAARCELWVVNGTPQAARGEVRIRLHALSGGARTVHLTQVDLPPNQAVELGALALAEEQAAVVCAAQLWVEGTLVARAALWPALVSEGGTPLQAPGIVVRREPGELVLTTQRPAKGVWIAWEGGPDDRSEGFLDNMPDNMIDLVPGDEQRIAVPGLPLDAPLQVRWAGDHLHQQRAEVRP